MRTIGSERLKHALVLLMMSAGFAGRPHACGAAAADSSGSTDAVSSSIRFYQRYLSGVRHVHCRFEPSCSQYALDAIAAYGLLGGTARAADRLMRCNSSAARFYAAGTDGRLVDPARGGPGRLALRAPAWLLPVEPPDGACFSAAAPESARGRAGETFDFGGVLAAGADCARAETEYLRAAFLTGTESARICAQRASGRCWFESSAWIEAEERFLAAAMLGRESDRAPDVYRAALCRFNAGDPAGCSGLLAEFETTRLLAAAAAVPASAESPDDEARWLGLAGLCSMRRGIWEEARTSFDHAARITPEPAMAWRFESLANAAAGGPEIPRAQPRLASGLSALVPGAGQIYAGRTSDGVRTLIVNGALIWTVAALARDGYVPAAVLVGAVTVPFYVGNISGAGASARMINRDRRSEYLERSLAAVRP